MFRKSFFFVLVLLALVVGACAPQPTATQAPPPAPPVATEAMDDEMMAATTFVVRIDNVSPAFAFTGSGAFNTPAEAAEPGPLTPGNAYEFNFEAAPGSSLSFATMFVQSNDLFYAPDEAGIALFDADGKQVSGDVTSQVMLWDAGTEVNQEPGVGADQAPRQAGPDTGEAENGVVQLVDDGFIYPDTAASIQVTLEAMGGTSFMARIENISSEDAPVILAPGVFVVHSEGAPLFTNGEADRGEGLEALAEDGNPGPLSEALAAQTGAVVVLAPGAWEANEGGASFFAAGEADRGEGLEALAEDGNPASLVEAVMGMMADAMHFSTGAFNTPVGASEPGPVAPDGAYEFTFEASSGQYLTFATMFVQSNDWFFAPGENGIALFDANDMPISGDITDMLMLWDAGTEANQVPGVGLDQAPRQAGPNTGETENGVVQLADLEAYGIMVTITPQK